MKKVFFLIFIQAVLINISYGQTIVVDYDQKLKDTVYVYNGDFLYDHSGTGQTQLFAECVGKINCRLYFRFNGRYPFITNYSTLVATTMDTKYTSPITNWDYEKMQYGGVVYTFDVPISKEALKKFSKTDILRFQVGNYLFTATDNIRYGLGKLYSRTIINLPVNRNTDQKSQNNNTNKRSYRSPSKAFNKIDDFKFSLVEVEKMKGDNYLFAHIYLNASNKVTIFSPIESYLESHPNFNPAIYDGKILSYLNCEVLPKNGLADESGNINPENKWVLPTDIAKVTDQDSVNFFSNSNADSLTFSPSSGSSSEASIFNLIFKVPKNHTGCDLNFLGTSSNMDSLLVEFEN